MGAFGFPPGYSLKTCIYECTHDQPVRLPGGERWVQTIAKCVRGNIKHKVRLWTVIQVCNKRDSDGFVYRHEPSIDLFVLEYAGTNQDRGWIYRTYFEEEGPCYWDCPLSYLAMCPVKSLEWREGVLDYYHAQAFKRRYKNSLKKKDHG